MNADAAESRHSLTVVVAAGGAPWEAAALDEIRRSARLQLHRRCLDVAELLALSGLCDVAVVSIDMAGLDADAVLTLQRDGVRVLGVGPEERGHHLGIGTMTVPGEIESQLREPEDAASSEVSGGLLAVWGPHGAPGRSVLAASVASAWARSGQRVTLVDADPRGGAQAQMFAILDEVSGLVAACRSANHGDLAALADHAVTVDPGLRLLTGVTRAEMWEQVREGPFQIVLRTMTQVSDAVVVDLGPGLDPQTRHVLGVADQVLVVGRADPVGLARLVRALHDLGSVALAAPVVVVNHLRSTSVWSERDVRDAVERLAGVRPDVFVPADFKTLDTAALRGKVPAQVASGSPFVAAVETLLGRLSPLGHTPSAEAHGDTFSGGRSEEEHVDRLSPLDALFLSRDTPTEPRQIASLVILEPDDSPLTFDGLIKALNERLDIVPRYRQVPYKVPGGVGTPVWRDYPRFDVAHHVRRSALPKPGGRAELHELVGRLVARRLELDRPLWELYFVEGLANGAEALLFKAHQALVDGSETIDLAQVLLEETDRVRDIPHHEWKARPEPDRIRLLVGSVDRHLRHPGEALATAELQFSRLRRALPLVGGSQAPPRGILSATLSRHRRFSSLSTDLADYRRVRDEHGGTINDVILASIAGGIRGWMLTRAERATAKTAFRAIVPMSVVSDEGLPTSLGSKVRGHLLSLPVGESNAVVRLHQVSYALKDHRETGSAVAANKLAGLPGFATSTFHAVGARVAEAEANRGHQIVITNVPGPQETVYMAGEPVAEVYPCIPLTEHRTVSIGVTSYRGHVFYGITADREAVPDVDVLAQCIEDALAELVETVHTKTRAPRGRQRPQR